MRSGRCSGRKQAAANTGIVSSFQRGLCNLSLLLRAGEVLPPHTCHCLLVWERGEASARGCVWHFGGSPPSAGLKGTQVFQCNLIYKFILFLKERTEITHIRIWVNSSEPHSTSCQKCLVPLTPFGRTRQTLIVFLCDPERALLRDGIINGR